MKAFLESQIFSSNTPGPTIALVALTHGNEPVGLTIFENLISSGIFQTLQSGRVLLICSNVLAYEEYMNQEDPLKYRFLDHDMNRIWDDGYIENSREYERREQVKKMLEPADIVLDIHSISKGDDVLGVAGFLGGEESSCFMDVQKILIEKDTTRSMRAWCARQGKLAYGLEAGNHISENGFKNGLRIVLNMLIHFKLLSGEKEYIFSSPEKLEFVEELKPKTENFRYARAFDNWESIGKGEIYAYDDGDKPLSHNLEGDIRIGLVQKKPQFGRGAGFLFRKIEL